MKNIFKFAYGLIILCFCAILLSIVLGLDKKDDLIKNALVDVTNISYEKSVLELKGQWEFYWSQSVSPGGKIQNTENMQIVNVPSMWTKYKDKDNKKLPVEGYGVYKLIIKATKGDNLALKIPQIGDSYNLWVDGKLRYSSGQVGKSSSEEKPKWTTKVINFTVENEYTDIMIEESNFNYFRAGITTPIILGTEAQVQQLKYTGIFLDTFIFAALFVMAVFFVLLYLLHTKNKAYIYLALFSMVIAVRPLIYGESYLNNMFPNINFQLNTKIYIINFIALQLFFLYFYYQYEGLFNRKYLCFIEHPLILIIIVGVIIPAKYMIYPVIILEAMIPVVSLVCIYMFFIAYKNKYEGVGINIASVLLLLFLAIVDILNNDKIINLNIYYTPIALLIITAIQTFLQVCKFRESALLNERLAHEIEKNNLKLGYERRQRNLTEKLNNALKSMASTLEIEKLLIRMIHNLSQVIDVENILITLNVDENYYIVANKLENTEIKYVNSIGKISYKHKATQTEIKKLYPISGIEKNLIIKPLCYNEELFCTIKMIIRNDEYSIDEEIMQLIDIYSEQSILALQNAKSYKKIKDLAMYDELTKLYNRRYLMKLGREQFINAENYCTAMMDIDHFKKINDTYGHIFGDTIIKGVAELCKKVMPEASIIGRFGGEEFIVFFKDVKFDAVLSLMEQLRKEIENSYYFYKNDEKVKVTISIGIAMKQLDKESLHNMINNADEALYKAKAAGRNCVRTYI